MDSERSGLVISDFNVDAFTASLINNRESPVVHATAAPFGQVIQVLTNDASAYWSRKQDFVIVWTQPESVVPSFKRLLDHERVPLESVLSDVDAFASSLLNIQNKVSAVFVPTWVMPPYHRGLGMLDMRKGCGLANTLMQMNLRLAERLDNSRDIYLLNAERWMANAAKDSFNPKLWYAAKIPFGLDVFQHAVTDIKAAIRGLMGFSKKLIVLDLDDTLWGGTVGDVGWENLTLGGHDILGEAYVDFQASLKSLVNRGVSLAIVSKNEEAVALEAIRRHPEMVLTVEDFAGWRINWNDKAQNIVDLASELRLGTQSMVFIDDSRLERARVKEALPEISVPEWPDDKTLYKKALLSLTCFDVPSLTEEDVARTRMYQVEQQRMNARTPVVSLDDWLRTLDIGVKIEDLTDANLARTTQLLNKTNQMNLSTRRLTESELKSWAAHRNHRLWTIRVSDKFGDMGLTGIVSLEADGGRGRIVDFLLSCRVMGRKIEHTMLHAAIKYAASLDLKEVWAAYIPTSKNNPCLEFWKTSGFTYNEPAQTFHWDTAEDYPASEQVRLEWPHASSRDHATHHTSSSSRTLSGE